MNAVVELLRPYDRELSVELGGGPRTAAESRRRRELLDAARTRVSEAIAERLRGGGAHLPEADFLELLTTKEVTTRALSVTALRAYGAHVGPALQELLEPIVAAALTSSVAPDVSPTFFLRDLGELFSASFLEMLAFDTPGLRDPDHGSHRLDVLIGLLAHLPESSPAFERGLEDGSRAVRTVCARTLRGLQRGRTGDELRRELMGSGQPAYDGLAEVSAAVEDAVDEARALRERWPL